MLVSGIVIVILVVAGVAVMFAVMQENADVADNVVEVADHSNERVKENVDVTKEPAGLQLHNKGPEIKVLEYRVLDDDGVLLRSCPVNLEVSASKKETIDVTNQVLRECWQEFVTP